MCAIEGATLVVRFKPGLAQNNCANECCPKAVIGRRASGMASGDIVH